MGQLIKYKIKLNRAAWRYPRPRKKRRENEFIVNCVVVMNNFVYLKCWNSNIEKNAYVFFK